MKASMNSFNLGGKDEDQRRIGTLELGDTVNVKQLTHRWSDPPPAKPGDPHIANGSAKIDAPSGTLFCMLFLGRHPKDRPFTAREIEERLNKLGWFRRENG